MELFPRYYLGLEDLMLHSNVHVTFMQTKSQPATLKKIVMAEIIKTCRLVVFYACTMIRKRVLEANDLEAIRYKKHTVSAVTVAL